MAPSFKTAATILGLAGLAAAKFNAASKSNVVAYWGQGPNQKNLIETCADPSIDVVNIAFINEFPDNSPGNYPGSNFGNQCPGTTYNGDNGVKSDLLSGCPYIPQDIKDCQSKYGKTVMLSLGGAKPGNYYLESDTTAARFAEFLWYAFGPVNAEWKAAGMPRPFGDAVVDGFDFDIEGELSTIPKDKAGNPIPDYKSRGYGTLIDTLRIYYATDLTKTYYISGSPQCNVPDEHLSAAIATSYFDWLFVQFYNTDGCSARNGVDYLEGKTTKNINFGSWNSLDSANPEVKIILGLPASPDAALPGFYISQSEANELISSVYSYDNFAGVGIWEATYSQLNALCNENYAYYMKSIVKSLAAGKPLGSSAFTCVVSTSSASVTATATVSTKTSTASVSTSTLTSASVSTMTSASASTSSVSASASSSVSVASASASSVSASMATSSVSASMAISSASASSVSASCLSKPSNLHTKSRTRANHSIGWCTSSGCGSKTMTTAAATKSEDASMSVSASCLSKPSNAHTKSRTKANHPIGYCTSGCDSMTLSTAGATKSEDASIPVYTNTAPASKSVSASETATKSEGASISAYTNTAPASKSVSASESVTKSEGASISAYTNTAPATKSVSASESAPVYESVTAYESDPSTKKAITSTAPVYESKTTVSTTCTEKLASSTAAVESSVPYYGASTEVVKSSTAVESSMPYYGASTEVVKSSTAVESSMPYYGASTEVVKTTTVDVKSTSSAATVTVPAYGETSMPAKSSAVVVESSMPPYKETTIVTLTSTAPAKSSVVVESSVPAYWKESSSIVTLTSTAPAKSTVVVVESSVPAYHKESSTVAIVTSTITAPGYEHTAPVYGASTTGAAAPSSSAHEEHSAPGEYKPSTSVSPASSSVAVKKSTASASVSTIYVVPVGPSTTAAYGMTPTTSKPATYTGAASKSVVGMGMLTAIIGATLLLL